MSILTGRRVALRPVEAEDAEELHRLLNHDGLVGCRHIPDDYPDELPLSTADASGIAEKWITDRKEDPHYMIDRVESQEIVGHANMGWSWDAMTPWMSVVIDPEHWRHGFGSEALQLMLRYQFGTTPANTVSDWVPEWNEAALAFARKHGFQETGRVRHAGLREGRPFDLITMDILRTEWQARHREADHGA